MEIIHDLSRKQFQTVADGKTAYVSYDLVDGCLNIEHNDLSPGEIEGAGVSLPLLVKVLMTMRLTMTYFRLRHAGMRQSGWIGILNTKIRFRL